MVDLKAKPFYLDDEKIKWVRETVSKMSDREKVGQLFCCLGASGNEKYLEGLLARYKPGGMRYNPATGKEVFSQNKFVQKTSEIPLLIACNAEGGGDGVCTDGTPVGLPVKIGATADKSCAYDLGKVCGREAQAAGCNITFSPVSDISMNWRNPIVSRRCFSNDADSVLEYSKAYYRGVRENSNVICAVKHFPGDGVDERDQHLSRSVNNLNCREWDKTYGKVYRGMIDAGVEAVMTGHIMLPAYSKRLNPRLKDEDILPASLSKEILTGLLRKKLGFNGLIVSDASHMVGMTCEMKRSDMLAACISAGCDMFLFFNDPDEDFGFMLDAVRDGRIEKERLSDALERILGTKAALGLTSPFELSPSRLPDIGCPEHMEIARRVSEKSVTLVKNLDGILPISPDRHRRVLIVPVKALAGANLFSVIDSMKKTEPPEEMLKKHLEQYGFSVEVFESPFEKMAKLPPEKRKGELNVYFAGKSSIKSFTDNYDLVITLENISTYGQTVERVAWSMSKGGGEIPWYVHELPVIVVSLANPFALADVPQARTYINAYSSDRFTIDALVSKLLGITEFEGVDPVDAFCGKWDTRI